MHPIQAALLVPSTLLLCAGAARAQAPFEHAIDAAASTVTFGGTTLIGPIQGVPTNTIGLDGAFVVELAFASGAAASGAFAGGEAVTIPATFSAIVPNPFPFLPPLASLAFHDLHLSLATPSFAVLSDSTFGVDAVLTIVSGTVDVTPILGSPETFDLAGTVTDPQPVSGTIVVEPDRIRSTILLDATIAFDDPGSGLSGTVTLTGALVGEDLLFETFCFGDGSGSACPCANASAPGSAGGCLNSFGTPGRLVGSGVARVGADSVLLSGSGMPPVATALYFQGTQAAGSGLGTPFGDGLLCATGAVIRLGAVFNVGGASTFPPPATPSLAVRGAIPEEGATRRYQVWYRNTAPAFCPPQGFNLTNGLELTWIP